MFIICQEVTLIGHEAFFSICYKEFTFFAAFSRVAFHHAAQMTLTNTILIASFEARCEVWLTTIEYRVYRPIYACDISRMILFR